MVGNLSVESEVSKTEIKKGDVFSIKLTLIGSGNLHNTDYPKLQLPKGLTLYGDPKADEKYVFTANGAVGKINLEYTIQVNKGGSFSIPPIEISYFDIKLKKYVSLKTDEINLKGEEVKMASVQSKGKTTVIAERREGENNKDVNNNSFLKSPFLWISISSVLLIAGFIGFAGRTKKPVIIAFDKSTLRKEPSIVYTWNDVDSYFKSAENAQINEDYNSLFLALENAINIGLKVSLDEHETVLTSKQLLGLLSQKIQNPEIINDINKSLDLCQNARYGFGLDSDEINSILPSLKTALNKLKNI
jgi:hypothetical protein